MKYVVLLFTFTLLAQNAISKVQKSYESPTGKCVSEFQADYLRSLKWFECPAGSEKVGCETDKKFQLYLCLDNKERKQGKSYIYDQAGRLKAQRYFVDNKTHGFSRSFHENGELAGEMNFVNGIATGRSYSLYTGNRLQNEVHYVNDKRSGEGKSWHENGIQKSAGQFVNDKKDGEFKNWNDKGELVSVEIYKKGKLKKTITGKKLKELAKKPEYKASREEFEKRLPWAEKIANGFIGLFFGIASLFAVVVFGLWAIGFGFYFLQALIPGPKRDRRFKTGFKNNEVEDTTISRVGDVFFSRGGKVFSYGLVPAGIGLGLTILKAMSPWLAILLPPIAIVTYVVRRFKLIQLLIEANKKKTEEAPKVESIKDKAA